MAVIRFFSETTYRNPPPPPKSQLLTVTWCRVLKQTNQANVALQRWRKWCGISRHLQNRRQRSSCRYVARGMWKSALSNSRGLWVREGARSAFCSSLNRPVPMFMGMPMMMHSDTPANGKERRRHWGWGWGGGKLQFPSVQKRTRDATGGFYGDVCQRASGERVLLHLYWDTILIFWARYNNWIWSKLGWLTWTSHEHCAALPSKTGSWLSPYAGNYCPSALWSAINPMSSQAFGRMY